MSGTPRSVLKKPSISSENRKVHFAEPVTCGSKISRKKQLPMAKSGGSAPKKSKIPDFSSIQISNIQSDLLESIREVEVKFAKQSRMTMELTNELLAVTDSMTAAASETKKVGEMLVDSAQRLENAQRRALELVDGAEHACQQFQIRSTNAAKVAEQLAELQKSIEIINSSQFGTEPDFEHVLALLNHLERDLMDF